MHRVSHRAYSSTVALVPVTPLDSVHVPICAPLTVSRRQREWVVAFIGAEGYSTTSIALNISDFCSTAMIPPPPLLVLLLPPPQPGGTWPSYLCSETRVPFAAAASHRIASLRVLRKRTTTRAMSGRQAWGDDDDDDYLPPRQESAVDSKGVKSIVEYHFNDNGAKVLSGIAEPVHAHVVKAQRQERLTLGIPL